MTDLSRAGDRPVLRLRDASVAFGHRTLWSGLDLDVAAGEFITVLGANGSGKSTLLKAVLGLRALSAGSIEVLGRPARRGNRSIGYVPQQRLIPAGTPMRGRDLVSLGVDGHRPGLRLRGRRAIAARVDAAIEAVEASRFAARPVGQLSGGEQQRLRVAQALVADPGLLLCDELLISLDLHHQRAVSGLVDRRRRTAGTPVLFVTHDVNPVLAMTDRVLYFAAGQHRLGVPEEVLRSDVLSELYGTRVDVARIGERLVVLGAPDHHQPHHPDRVEVHP
ncbi:metal ABC transporter ATP-binding protein [Nocardioides sp.]|uniref:metal ABC transporter ATP-binding protein n=1 Tax=Nocardioides sp. TaxID=35761 RepID=UPI0035110F90